MSYDFDQVEERWRDRWAEDAAFEPEVAEDREKFFITVAYPYPSGAMHVGHVRTFTLPDVFARFKRMQGYNVLFPMAWHVTGTPIVGALNRLKEGEEEQLRVLKEVFGVPEEELEAMEEPMDFASYFIENSYKAGMKRLGFSVDWRREFNTDQEHYKRFIGWQYRKLREQGHVSRGLHPTKFCLSEENPVTTHDLLEGEDADRQNYTLVKFRDGDGRILPMATLRPETVYGVTNAFVDPDGEYVEAAVDGETWVVSRDAVVKLDHQGHDVAVERELSGEELVGLRVENPVTGDEVPVLPATFVDTGSATGVVMSVPAHAPFDHVAVRDAQDRAEELAERYPALDAAEVRSIEPVSLIDVEGMGEFPAVEVVQEMGIESQDDPALEEATGTVYNREFHDGVLKDVTGEFAGRTVSGAKDDLRERFEGEAAFDEMFEFSEDVVCRCGSDVIVAKTDTWFLEYGDSAWKEEARNVLAEVETVPENTREDYSHTIDWLDSWPCIRNYGLGTRLPFDDRFVIEPLSDSTIYMAFYTLSHALSEADAEQVDDAFFDHVLLGEGSAEDVAEGTGMRVERVEELRESFSYWYPLDWRTSGHDLVQNHLTFFMFHHAALFPERNWPRGVATWGMGLLEGEKMSSSKGRVVLAEEAVERYGADTTRFFLFEDAEPWQDFDWRADQVEATQKRLRSFYQTCTDELTREAAEPEDRVDRWMLSRLEERAESGTEALEAFQTRKAIQEVFYGLNGDVKWYRRRKAAPDTAVLGEVRRKQIRLLAPFVPHMAEELWSRVSDDTLTRDAWPAVDEDRIDPGLDAAEDLVKRTLNDVREIVDVTGKDPDEVAIYVAADWKKAVLREALAEEVQGLGDLMPRVMRDEEMRSRGGAVKGVASDVMEAVRKLEDPELAAELDEEDVLAAAEPFLERELSCQVRVESEESGGEHASGAIPTRPAIRLT